jgi:hypothetical protein
MPSNPREARTVLWEQQLAYRIPGSPWLGASGLAALLYGFYLVLLWEVGAPVLEPRPDSGWMLTSSARFTLGATLLVAFLLGAFRYGGLTALADLASFGPLAEPFEAEAQGRLPISTDPEQARRSRIAGSIGLGVGALVVSAMIAADPGGSFRDNLIHTVTHPEDLWLVLLGLAGYWMLGRIAYLTIAVSSELRELGRALPVDLLNLRPLHVFGRAALRRSLLWIVGISAAWFFFELNPGPGVYLGHHLGYLTPLLALAIPVLALVLSMQGVHRRIVQTKQSELARVEDALRGDTQGLKETRIAHRAEAMGVADLLAYKSYVESLSEWPFDTTMRLRLALYLLIPLFSWAGGAMTERLLNLLLD